MHYTKMMRFSCVVFAVLTVLLLRTAVAQAASTHAETNMAFHGAAAMPTSINQRLIAHSHKSTWTSVGSPNNILPNQFLEGVATISSKDVWAVGYSQMNTTSPLQTLTEHWNGTYWSIVASPNVGTSDNLFNAVVANSSNDVWAVGDYRQSSTSPSQTLTEHWNGTKWSVVASPNVGASDNYFYTVTAISSTDVWAAGDWSKTSKSPFQTLTEHWNGSSWSVVSSPNVGKSDNDLYGLAAISSTDVWAVGDWSQTSTSPFQTLAEHWDGSSWSVVTSPNVGQNTNYFFWVTAVSTNDVWAIGTSYTNSTSPAQTLSEHWDGSSWSVVTSPDVGTFDNFLNAVVAVSSKDVWATGYYATSSGSSPPTRTLTEHWNGTAWSVVPSPNFGGANTVNELWGLAAVSTNDVWTVGDNYTSSTTFQAFTMHWDGKKWSIIPPA